MLKVRYFKVKLAVTSIRGIVDAVRRGGVNGASIEFVSSSSQQIIVRFTSVRQLSTVQYLPDGSSVSGNATTMERSLVRIFQRHGYFIFSVLEPPRGTRLIDDLIVALFGASEYYVEPLTISREMIDGHISSFGSAKLVSAKIRDIPIYEKAIARLEVTSKEGLQPGIAALLEGKYYRVDSMTFEVSDHLIKGLVTYLSNGTLRMSNALSDIGFPSFESQIM